MFGAAVVIGCLATVRLAVNQIPLPYQINYEEGNVLNAGVRIAQGESPYPRPGGSLYIFNPYGPVVYDMTAVLVEIFGPSFTYPRWLVAFAALCLAGLLALLLHHWTQSWKLSLWFGFLYLALPVVRDWVFLLRVDLVGVALTVAGLYLFCASAGRWYLAPPFFVAALFCKYTLVAAPAACCLYLLFRKQWRQAVRLAAGTSAPTLLLFFWEQRATDGWFAFDMFRTHLDPFSFSHWWSNFYPLPAVCGVLLVLTCVFLAENRLRGALALPAIYFLLASLTSLTAGKQGSDTNHFLEWLAALCLAAALGYDVLRKKVRGEWAIALVPAVLTLTVLISVPREVETEPGLDGCPQAYDYVKTHPGKRFLVENVGAVVAARKPVLFSSSFIYAFLVKNSVLSEAALAQLVRARYFDVIVLGENLEDLKQAAANPASPDTIWPPAFVAAVEQSYRPTRQFGCLWASFAYEPNVKLADSAAQESAPHITR